MNGLRCGLVVTLALWCAACSSEAGHEQVAPNPHASRGVKAPAESLIVSAAASTREAIERLAEEFEADTGTEVKVNSGPSSGLASQIIAAAPVDLFFSASQQWAEEVSKHNQAAAMVRLLTNRLVLVVPSANPGGVKDPQDLLLAGVKKVALAGESVPAGIYADQALSKLGLLQPLIRANKIIRGQDVRSALSYVERGEAEAGIVYSTDLLAADGLRAACEFDPGLHDEIVYVLVLLKHGSGKPQAHELFEYLQSQAADTTYEKFGFSRLQ